MRSDQELIQLVRESSAEELSSNDVQELRARWTENAELRDALLQHLQFESSLAEVLGDINLTVDGILHRAENSPQNGKSTSRRGWWISLGLASLMLLIGGGIWLSNPNRPPQPNDDPNHNLAQQHPNSDSPTPPALGQNANAPIQMAANAAQPATGNEPSASPPNPASATSGAEPERMTPPWEASLTAETAEILPENSPEFVSDIKSIGHNELSEAMFRKWFREVPGHALALREDKIGNRRIAHVKGISQFLAPWKADAVWRLTPFDVNSLGLYFWKGNRGIALKWYPHMQPQMWAAYAIERESPQPVPKRWGLLTTDNGADYRTTAATVDVRWQQGRMILSQGQLPFLQAPFAEMPEEVYLEGELRLRGCSIVRAAPISLPAADSRPVQFGEDQTLASQSWKPFGPSAGEITLLPNGGIRLQAEQREHASMQFIPLPQTGSLCEVVVRVAHAEPGTGWYLGDADGKPISQIAYFKEKRTGGLSFGHLWPGDSRMESDLDPNQLPTAHAAFPQWIRFVVGWGSGRMFVSGDGQHFGVIPADNPVREIRQPFLSFGVFAQKGTQPRSIQIDSMQIRKLTGILEQAPAEAFAAVPTFTDEELKSSPLWFAKVMASRPGQFSDREWLHACAIRGLNAQPPRDVAYQWLRGLIRDAVDSNQPVDRKLRLLEEAAWLMDLWDEGGKFAQAYERLALRSAREMNPVDHGAIRSALIRLPLWSNANLRNLFDKVDAHMLLTHVYRHEWDRVAERTDELQFSMTNAHPDIRVREQSEDLDNLASWARRSALELRPDARKSNEKVLPAVWRNPWLVQLSKDGYNARAELEAALTGSSFEDACRVVSSLAVSDSTELLPDIHDKELYVSLRTSVANALRNSGDFQRVMTQQFGPQGLIRVRQAIAEGDANAIRAATLQFFGTTAAVEAHKWWGDRALAAGDFSEADEQFGFANRFASAAQRLELEPRQRLAAALGGRTRVDQSTAPLAEITLNGATLSTAELRDWIRTATSQSVPRQSPQPLTTVSAAPNPRTYRAESRANFDAQAGLNVGKETFRQVDWFATQLGIAADEKNLYLHTRFQTNAYDRKTLKLRWAEGLGKDQGEAHGFSLLKMVPLSAGNTVYVRRLTIQGVELAALDRDKGTVRWRYRPQTRTGANVVSDPIIIDGALACFQTERSDNDSLELQWITLNPATGTLLKTLSITRFRDVWNGQLPLQLAYEDHDLVATVGGNILCLSDTGQLRWMRRQTWLPPVIDDLRNQQRPSPPIVQGDRVFVVQPGIRAVCCLERESGKLIWEQPLPAVTGILALRGDSLIVRTHTSVVAMKTASGEPVWRFPLGTAGLNATTCDSRYCLIAMNLSPGYLKEIPSLVWLDLQSGLPVHSSLIANLEEKDPCLGPLFPLDDRWLVLTGKSWKEPPRELCELIETGPAAIGGPVASFYPGWTSELPGRETQQMELSAALPGWHSVHDLRKKIAFPKEPIREETGVVQFKLDKMVSPIILARTLTLPTSGQPKLRLRCGQLSGQSWKLTVKVEERVLLEQELNDESTKQGWLESELGLQPWLGKTVTTGILLQSTSAKEPEALIKRLEFSFESP